MSVNIQTADGLKRLLDEEHSNNTGIHITDAERCTWNSKSDFSGNYNDLDNKPNIIDDGSNNLAIADTDGNVVFKVDADGTHTTALEIDGKDIIELINSNGFSGDYNDLKNKPNIIEDGSGNMIIADESGNIIAQVNDKGIKAYDVIVGDKDTDISLTEHIKENPERTTHLHITSDERVSWNEAKSHADSEHARIDATFVEQSNTNGNIKINGNETTVYSHPNHTLSDIIDVETSATELNYIKGVTSNVQEQLNSKSTFSGDYNDLINAPNIAEDESGSLIIADESGKKAFEVTSTGITNTAKLTVGGKDLDTELQSLQEQISSYGMDTTKTFEDLTILVTGHIDETNNPHVVTKEQVGLGNVDNTSDINKPVSIATQEAIDTHAFDTNNPHMVDKVHVGLGNVNNTSDLNKPISKATQVAIDNLNSIDYSLIGFDTSWIIPESAESQSIVDTAVVGYARVGHI